MARKASDRSDFSAGGVGVAGRGRDGSGFAAIAGVARFEPDFGGGDRIEDAAAVVWAFAWRAGAVAVGRGVGLEMELSGRETAVGVIPASGGMRVGFTPKKVEPLPEVQAGE